MPFIAIALIVAAALGGGVSVAAQHSLPGDALWGFKVQINERAQESLAAGDKGKADVDIALLQTRLDEAQALSAKGSLDADAQADLSGNFDAHARDVGERVKALEAQGDYAAAADVAARFQATVARNVSAFPSVQMALDAASSLSTDAAAKAALR